LIGKDSESRFVVQASAASRPAGEDVKHLNAESRRQSGTRRPLDAGAPDRRTRSSASFLALNPAVKGRNEIQVLIEGLDGAALSAAGSFQGGGLAPVDLGRLLVARVIEGEPLSRAGDELAQWRKGATGARGVGNVSTRHFAVGVKQGPLCGRHFSTCSREPLALRGVDPLEVPETELSDGISSKP